MSTSWWRIWPTRQQQKTVEFVSVMSTWAIWGGAVLLLAVASVSTYMLLNQFGAGTPEDRVRLEAIRLAGTIVIGSGGGVALLLAARRQRTFELSLKQQQHDADERRITELYTAAAEQLGSDKAPVRLAALYALERLGNDHPSHRQIVIDLFCAYLRMSFTPPENPRTPSLTVPMSKKPRRLGLRPPSRQPQRSLAAELRDAVTAITGTVSEKPISDQAQQELEVRLTAQRLIINHLRVEFDGENIHFSDGFWGDINLDLTGATLVEWRMNSCLVGDCDFDQAVFYGQCGFGNTVFHEGFWAQGCQFLSIASWFNIDFLGSVSFDDSSFREVALFREAHFREQASFTDAIFHGKVGFRGISVDERAWFDGATFRDDVVFGENEFHDTTLFEGAKFRKSVRFKGAKFHSDVEFVNAEVCEPDRTIPPNGWRLKPLEDGGDQVGRYAAIVRDVSIEAEESSASPVEP